MAVKSIGVYTLEQDQSQYVSATSPLNPAAVIYASWGPYDTIKTITSVSELVSTFGEVMSVAYVGLIGIKKYFKYGSTIKLVRAVGSSDAYGTLDLDDSGSDISLAVRSLYKGAYANRISISYALGTLSVYVEGKLKEKYTGLTKSSATDKNSNFKAAINNISDWIYIPANADADTNTDLPATLASTNLSGGISVLPSKATFIGTATGGPSSGPSGLQCFANDGVEANVLLSIDAGALGTTDSKDVMKEIESIAASRLDLVGLVGSPAGMSRDSVVTFMDTTAAFNSTYVAASWPWVKFTEAAVNADVFVPSTAAHLMVLAKNDRIAFPWYGAFGFNRGSVTEALAIEYATSSADRNILEASQINVFINKSGFGVVLMGNYTKSPTTKATQSLNVRRLLLFVKKALSEAAESLLAEPLDLVTQTQFKSMADRFLLQVQAKRGLTSFLFVCDATNNPPELIAQKTMAATVKLQPTRSTEIIELSMQVTSTGAKFDE